jgi:hypothetical protein
MAETPTNSEFSTWLKDILESEPPSEKGAAKRHKKRWEEMGSENGEPTVGPEPPNDDSGARG